MKGPEAMSHDRMTTLFFELFSGLPRQGPGDTDEHTQGAWRQCQPLRPTPTCWIWAAARDFRHGFSPSTHRVGSWG